MTTTRAPRVRAARTTLATKRRVAADVPPPAPPGPQRIIDPPTRGRSRVGEAVGLFILIAIVHVAVSLSVGEIWYGRLLITIEYAVPCGLAMALFGLVRQRTPPWSRIVSAAAVALLVWLGILLGGWVEAIAFFLFLLFLPLWAVLAVTGTGRANWTRLQFAGATLVLEAVWIPLYNSFPDLTNLATATGTLRPYSVAELYSIVTTKLLHETILIVIGIFLIVRRFPFVQKRPEAADWHQTWATLGATNRHPAWLTLGLGATTLVVALFGSVLLQNLLLETPVGQSGADDTRVFERITPELVILLSFAAGVGEELIFRGVLQPALERTFRRAIPAAWAAFAAIVVQAVLFGVVHAGYGNLIHVLLPFAFGLLTGTAYRLWGILPAIYAHFMVDVFAFGYDAAQRYAWVDPVLSILIVANLFAGIFAPLWLLVTWLLRTFWRRGREEITAAVRPNLKSGPQNRDGPLLQR